MGIYYCQFPEFKFVALLFWFHPDRSNRMLILAFSDKISTSFYLDMEKEA